MLKLAVIGAGQLGSRHLQAIALLDRPAMVTVLDPSDASIATARERFDQVTAREVNARFITSFDDLPRELDVAVVATGADARLSALQNLFRHSRVRTALLEKVLFQRLEDYASAEALLGQVGTRAWVNCAQRFWPFFRELRPRTLGASNVHIAASGANWGLGCNAIHNLDLLSYMTGTAEMRLESALDPGTIPSKRNGFLEFTGTLYAFSDGGNRVIQTSYRSGDAPFFFEVRTADFHAIWKVGEPVMRLAEHSHGWTWRELPVTMPYQSQLTHKVIEQILDEGRSDLPEYAESAAAHVAMLRVFLQHMAAASGENKLPACCPIT